MKNNALTNTGIRTTKAREKPFRIFDGGGLYLEVAPTGGKLWRLKYRFEAKQKLLALGTYPAVTLSKARQKRDEARVQLADGIDPGADRKARKQAKLEADENSFELIAREWFSKKYKLWAVSHSSRVIARLEQDIFPYLGARPVAAITAPELLQVLRKIEKRGSIETSHRVKQVCGQIFRFGIATGVCARDVAADLKGALSPFRGSHFAAATEPKQVANILRAIDGYAGSLPVTCAMKLAPYVFVRPGELRHARWADIDLEAAEWRYLVTKTGTPHIVPLSRQAVDILLEVHPLTGRGPYVFPSARSAHRPMSDNAVLAGFRRLGIDKAEMTGHGWRATARTLLDEVLGHPPHLIEHQLAHGVKDALGRSYNRTQHLPERKAMMQRWADYLDELRAGAIVIPFAARP